MKLSALCLPVVLGLSSLLVETAQASTAEADNFLKKSVDRVIEIAKTAPNTNTLVKNLRPVLLEIISFDTMTRRSVGPGWRSFAGDQQTEATTLLTNLVISTYAARFTPGELPVIEYKAASAPEPGRVEVAAITNYKGSKYDVIYRLEEVGGKGWRVTDVVIEGVSMVANYRSQLDAQFKSGGASAVITSLRKSSGSP